MELPKRKRNRLPHWDYDQNGVYFVTICTRNKEYLLGKVVGGGVLDAPRVELSRAGSCAEHRLLEMERIYPYISLPHYIIMPNHIHFLIGIEQPGTSGTPSPTNQTLPAFISTFKRLTNREYEKPLWQRSYYDHIIRDENDFYYTRATSPKTRKNGGKTNITRPALHKEAEQCVS